MRIKQKIIWKMLNHRNFNLKIVLLKKVKSIVRIPTKKCNSFNFALLQWLLSVINFTFGHCTGRQAQHILLRFLRFNRTATKTKCHPSNALYSCCDYWGCCYELLEILWFSSGIFVAFSLGGGRESILKTGKSMVL